MRPQRCQSMGILSKKKTQTLTMLKENRQPGFETRGANHQEIQEIEKIIFHKRTMFSRLIAKT